MTSANAVLILGSISSPTGPVYFDKGGYEIGSSGIITVIDTTKNIDSNLVDAVDVRVVSDIDHNGITLTLMETGVSTGIFTGNVVFQTNPSSGNQISVTTGNFVDVIYNDTADSRALIYPIQPVQVNPNPPVVMLDYPQYVWGYGARISVIDSTANTNINSPDSISVQVKSTNDDAGFKTTLVETGNNTDIFVNPALLILGNNTVNDLTHQIISIKVNPGSMVLVQYGNQYGAQVAQAEVKDHYTVSASGLGALDPPSFGQGTPEYVANCAAFGGDSDGDGICNNWELTTGGLNINLPGYVAYSYPVCSSSKPAPNCTGGVSPYTNSLDPVANTRYVKDVFVKMDYYTIPGPDTTALNDVRTAFSNQGIRLHIQLPSSPIGSGPYTGPINAITGGIQGTTGTITSTYQLNFPNDYNVIKFNNLAVDGANNPYVSKAQVFHYALYAFQMTSPNGQTSGFGEMIGNDMVITLMNWSGIGGTASVNGGGIPSTDLQEGTFMHELGHNLGLNHGGAANDNFNCKPNYFSVMNYLKQFQSTFPPQTGIPLRILGYSSISGLNTLNELSLAEQSGVGVLPTGQQQFGVFATPSIPGTITYQTTGLLSTSSPATPFDWDGISPATDSGVNQDIDNFQIVNCMGTVPDPINNPAGNTILPASDNLASYNDWPNLKLNFRTSSNFDSGLSSGIDPAHEGEMTLDTYHTIIKLNLDHLRNELYADGSADQSIIDTAFKKTKILIDNGDIAGAVAVLQSLGTSHGINSTTLQSEIDALNTAVSPNLPYPSVPEFGSTAMIILVIAIVSMIIVTKTRFSLN